MEYMNKPLIFFMMIGGFYDTGNCDFLYHKNALRAGAHCGGDERYCQRQPAAGEESCKAGFYMIQEIAISCIIKTLREDATRAETKMHLRAHTDAQRVTK